MGSYLSSKNDVVSINLTLVQVIGIYHVENRSKPNQFKMRKNFNFRLRLRCGLGYLLAVLIDNVRINIKKCILINKIILIN